MRLQTQGRPALQVAEISPNGKRTPVLVRLWEEAEQALAARRRAEPTPRRTEQAEPARVRYAYD